MVLNMLSEKDKLMSLQLILNDILDPDSEETSILLKHYKIKRLIEGRRYTA